MSPLDRAARDFVIHGGVWLSFGWRWALTTFIAHFFLNMYLALRSKP